MKKLFRMIALIGLILFFNAARAATISHPTLVTGLPGDVFYSIGVDANGTVVIPGQRQDSQGYFELVGGNLNFQELPSAGKLRAHGVIVSRDGHYLATLPESGPPQLWERPGLLMQLLPDQGWDSLLWLITPQGEPVVGGSIATGFISAPAVWSAADGFRDLTSLWGLASILTSASSDGHIVGTGSRWGEPVILYGTRTNCAVLHGQGNDNFDVSAISPNGKFIAGVFGRSAYSQGVLWTNLVPQLVAQPDDEPARYISAVSDSGFIGGSGRYLSGVDPRDGTPFLFDPILGRSRWFDEWWAEQASSPPLPLSIIGITDLYESNGALYCLLDAEGHPLAIAPLRKLQSPVLSVQKSSSGVRLRWSSMQVFVVETTASLLEGWSAVTQPPVVSGTDYSLDLSAGDETRFYRIRTP